MFFFVFFFFSVVVELAIQMMQCAITLEEAFTLIIIQTRSVFDKVICIEEMRTRTGSHFSAFAPEPARSLFLPLLSHFLLTVISA